MLLGILSMSVGIPPTSLGVFWNLDSQKSGIRFDSFLLRTHQYPAKILPRWNLMLPGPREATKGAKTQVVVIYPRVPIMHGCRIESLGTHGVHGFP